MGGRVPTFGGQALKQFGGKAGEKAGAKTGEKAGEKAGEGSPASQQITGKYTVPDEKHVKVQSEGFGKVLGPQIWGAEMKENRLTLDVNGKKTEFSKVE